MQWKRLIEEQASSGETISSFCRERSLTKGSFSWWKTELRKGHQQPEGSFIPLYAEALIRIILPSKVVLEVTESRLLSVLKTVSP